MTIRLAGSAARTTALGLIGLMGAVTIVVAARGFAVEPNIGQTRSVQPVSTATTEPTARLASSHQRGLEIPQTRALEQQEMPVTEQAHLDPLAIALDLNASDLASFVNEGGGTLNLGALGTSVSLQVQQASIKAGSRHIQLRSASGLVSTVTLRPNRFAATIATPTGVFRLRGTDRESWGVSHRSLDDRIVVERDYRHARSS